MDRASAGEGGSPDASYRHHADGGDTVISGHMSRTGNRADVEVLTRYNAFSILEKTRLERTHNGYIRRDGTPTTGKFFI
jgi:hypothetical protein